MVDNKYVKALDSVTWYNGLGEIVSSWINLQPEKTHGCIVPLPTYGVNVADFEDRRDAAYIIAQLQVIWMIAVMLFGDYGTSPRFGWIENIDGFREWIKKITATYREDELENDDM